MLPEQPFCVCFRLQPLGVDIRLQCLDQFTGSIRMRHRHEVDHLQRGEVLGTQFMRQVRPPRPLAHLMVSGDGHQQHIPL